MQNRKNILIIMVVIFICSIIYLLIPPELTLKYGKLYKFKRLKRISIKRKENVELSNDNRNIFGFLQKKRKKKRLKPPSSIKINVVKKLPVKIIKKKKVVENNKLSLIGYLIDGNDERVFIRDNDKLYIVKKGDYFLKKYKVEKIREKSVIVRNVYSNKLEKVGSRE